MAEETSRAKPVVRLTRWSVAYSHIGRGKRQRAEASRWTIYGIDADGVERVYMEHTTEAEYDAWRATDPLWAEVQSALFARLLADPKLRDFVLEINIKAAIDKGDTELALKLARHLSPEAWAKITKGAASEHGPVERVLPGHEAVPQLQGGGREVVDTSAHADLERDSDPPTPNARRRRKREDAQSTQPTSPSAEKIVEKADLAAARERSDESHGGPTEGAMVSVNGHESVGEHVFTTFKEARRALKAAETFGFDYVLTRSTTVKVTERDQIGDISETEADTIYSLQLFRTAIGGDESYEPPLAAQVAVLMPEDALLGEDE